MKPAPHPATGRPAAVLCALLIMLSACSVVPPSNVKSNARLTPASRITRDLMQLPEPKARIAVAVYGFRDQTGQFKPSPDSSYSTSVTQGAASMLVKALKDTGWYLPVEREGLQNLLTERKLVRAIESPSEKGKPAINLPNLTPASLIIEGGVIAFESNVRTGGKGANYLGIGASTQYRVDQVTVGLRSIDIRNGQVLNAVSVTKTIYSYQFSASIYKYTSYQHLLQAETGYTTNEPAQLAVREAIEAAVVHMTAQGVRDRFLELKDDANISAPVIQAYLAESMMNLSEDGRVDESPIGFSVPAEVAVIKPLLALEVAPQRAAPVIVAASVVSAPAAPASAAPALPARVATSLATPAPIKSAAIAAAPGATVFSGAAMPVPAAPATSAKPPVSTPAAQAGLASDDIFKQYWRQ